MPRAAVVIAWLSITGGTSAFLAHALTDPARRTLYLPGASTAGHHQIEQRCELCHSAGEGVSQAACLSCHAQELADADDSHPREKFLDPRNAALVRRLDGRRCVSCHVEHRPGETGAMGVTLAGDFCRTCHEDVAEERPSHRGLAWDGCQASGCHNYHDNRALGERFLADHVDEPALLPGATVIAPGAMAAAPGAPLARGDADAPDGAMQAAAVDEWAASAHAASGVNCSGCHGARDAWNARPDRDACRGCHAIEVAGFEGGKHGMRAAAGLLPMTPADARLPMRDAAQHRELGCSSCHGAHDADVVHASVDACLECHADQHSLAYRGSPHQQRWALERRGAFWAGSGVSCATCHMPRVRRVDAARPGVAALHDQNDALRPVETMVRPVCSSCHGVGYSLAALADRALIDRNFRGAPASAAASIDMVRRRPQPEERP
jgi:predicted CXXCH cytochrome family protein